MIAVDNGDLLDHEPFQATQCTLYQGTTQAIVRATAGGGMITVFANADGLPPASFTIPIAFVKPVPLVRSF